ncbi:Histone-lysine N-methyltransferase, H3 lysine-9 specific SUVH7 [Cardamine amara subsp. amara]|uniref:Histone-lysine N-methyltransferase, H3 lysine-9 specific SUVH7 n=1 Tax=Cardamine amara subsp. amara TaxID=228776 RepID=A0ABD1A1K2_CARAN
MMTTCFTLRGSSETTNLSLWVDAWEQVSEVFNLPSHLLTSIKESVNVSRFMNNSCSPNVFLKPIEYEMNCESYVRFGFLAIKHIPP